MNSKTKFIIYSICIIIFILVVFLVKTSFDKPVVRPEVLILNSQEKISIGNNLQLQVEIKNQNGGKVLWSSSNSSIVQIEQSGLLIAKSIGTSKITAIYIDEENRNYSKSFDITVSQGDVNILPTNISFQGDKILLKQGNVYKLPLNIEPNNAYLDNIVYESNDINSLKVSKDGTITALKNGTYVVNLSASDNKFNDSISIIVSDEYLEPKLIIEPTKLMFNNLETKIVEGESLELDYTYEPLNITKDVIEWSSSDEKVATVTNGVVNAIAPGKCVINVKSTNALTSSIAIEVLQKEVFATNLTLVPSTMLLKVGQTDTIIPNIAPTNTTNKDIKYQVNDNSIATSSLNQITALKEGTTIVTATTNNNIRKDLIVNVVSEQVYNENIDNINSDKDTISLLLKSSTGTLKGDYANVVGNKGKISIGVSKVMALNGLAKVEYCTYTYGSNECNVFSQINDFNNDFYVVDKVGVTVIRIKVTDNINNIIYKNYYASITSIPSSSGGSSSSGSSGSSGNSSSGSSDNNSDSDNSNTTDIHSSCGKKAQSLTGYVNGSRISYGQNFTLKVGETLTVKLYLPTRCGTIKLLTRTTASGQEGWDEYFKGNSVPYVNRNDPGTFLARNNFEWVITAKKSTAGKYITLSETTFQKTSAFSEIKSFFEVNVKVTN